MNMNFGICFQYVIFVNEGHKIAHSISLSEVLENISTASIAINKNVFSVSSSKPKCIFVKDAVIKGQSFQNNTYPVHLNFIPGLRVLIICMQTFHGLQYMCLQI